jgi:hypothetical protein
MYSNACVPARDTNTRTSTRRPTPALFHMRPRVRGKSLTCSVSLAHAGTTHAAPFPAHMHVETARAHSASHAHGDHPRLLRIVLARENPCAPPADGRCVTLVVPLYTFET